MVGEAEEGGTLSRSSAASSGGQAKGAEQSSINIESIAAVAGQSAGAVQEIAMRVNDMQQQVSGLHEVVHAFQLTPDVPALRAYNKAA